MQSIKYIDCIIPVGSISTVVLSILYNRNSHTNCYAIPQMYVTQHSNTVYAYALLCRVRVCIAVSCTRMHCCVVYVYALLYRVRICIAVSCTCMHCCIVYVYALLYHVHVCIAVSCMCMHCCIVYAYALMAQYCWTIYSH